MATSTLRAGGAADASAPLTGLPLLIAAIAIGFGNFLVVLDTTIANVSVPTIAGALGVSPSQGSQPARPARAHSPAAMAGLGAQDSHMAVV
jgi:MFS transporter, DHA2 family, multidrug resistance protein